MVVHPAKGHWSGTLASALVYHFQQLSQFGGTARPGIVHRLDRDTSGALVVAKDDATHAHLADQFQARTVRKEYLAIVSGCPDRDRDLIDQPIGDHPSQRERKALRAGHASSRDAQTFYEVEERFPGLSLLRAFPKTGRTHQIRLHFTHIRCPVLCDKLYGGRSRLTAGELRTWCRNKSLASGLDDDEILLKRQALHAHRLCFTHPTSGKELAITAPIPTDLQTLLLALRQNPTSG
jgi:23S rRNA pseudouridine1911/1915/1917 synthase